MLYFSSVPPFFFGELITASGTMHILPNQMSSNTLRWRLGIEFSVGSLPTLSLTDVPSKRPGNVCRLGLCGYGTWGGNGDFSDRAGGRENDHTSCLKAGSAGRWGEEKGVQCIL